MTVEFYSIRHRKAGTHVALGSSTEWMYYTQDINEMWTPVTEKEVRELFASLRLDANEHAVVRWTMEHVDE